MILPTGLAVKSPVVDSTGKVLDTTVIYPTPPQNKVTEAKEALARLVKKHGVQVFSIGNGTASKETEIFIAELVRELDYGLSYMVVNEAGASVYSASKLAAAEFPDFDVSIRSAVSIARRLQDPLAELGQESIPNPSVSASISTICPPQRLGRGAGRSD